MKNPYWLWIIGIVVVVGAVWVLAFHKDDESTQIANPASVHCANLGGILEIANEANGQAGYCHLPDGRVCEEWALYQGGMCNNPPTLATSTPTAEATTTAPAPTATTTPSAR